MAQVIAHPIKQVNLSPSRGLQPPAVCAPASKASRMKHLGLNYMQSLKFIIYAVQCNLLLFRHEKKPEKNQFTFYNLFTIAPPLNFPPTVPLSARSYKSGTQYFCLDLLPPQLYTKFWYTSYLMYEDVRVTCELLILFTFH